MCSTIAVFTVSTFCTSILQCGTEAIFIITVSVYYIVKLDLKKTAET